MDLSFADPSFFADLKLLYISKYILFLLTNKAYNALGLFLKTLFCSILYEFAL